MTTTFSRRSAIQAVCVAAGSSWLTRYLAGCAPAPSASASPTALATTVAPAPTAAAVVGNATRRPATKVSYGPNGTHYPSSTPWLGEKAALEIEVDPDWAKIAQALRSVGYDDVAAGVIIRVRPGTLPGNGYTSSAKAVLQSMGKTDWARNVLICPRDGYGTVTIGGTGIRLDQCSKLSLFGFTSTQGFVLTQCVGIQIGWSRYASGNATRGGVNLEFYELVLGFRRDPNDTAAVRPTDAFEMKTISRYGCLFGPSVKPAGSSAHCDTIQLEGTGTGTFGPFTSVDCVDYGSSNAAELLHTRVTLAQYEHCLILADTLPWKVFPLQSGDYQGKPNAFAGGCQDVRLADSVVVGPIGGLRYTHVENTTLSYQPQAKQQASVAGSWRVDTASASWTKQQILALQPTDGSEAALKKIWTWK